MGQELGLDGQLGVFPPSDHFAEVGGIPVNDDGGEEVEPGNVVVLARARQTEKVGALQTIRIGMCHFSVIGSSRQARRCP